MGINSTHSKFYKALDLLSTPTVYADPESFAQGSNFDNVFLFFWLMRGGRIQINITISGISMVRMRFAGLLMMAKH